MTCYFVIDLFVSALKQAFPHPTPPADQGVSIISVLSETRPSLCSSHFNICGRPRVSCRRKQHSEASAVCKASHFLLVCVVILFSGLSSDHAVPVARHEGGLALPSLVLLLLLSDLPADGAGAQQPQPDRQQHQSQHRDGGPVGVEGVGHRRHHDAGDEHHHAERDGAAVAGHLGAARRRCKLDFINVRDVRRHDDPAIPPGLVPAQLLGGDGRRHLHGASGNPATAAFAVEVIGHCDLAGEEQVSHLDAGVRDQPIREQLAVKSEIRFWLHQRHENIVSV